MILVFQIVHRLVVDAPHFLILVLASSSPPARSILPFLPRPSVQLGCLDMNDVTADIQKLRRLLIRFVIAGCS